MNSSDSFYSENTLPNIFGEKTLDEVDILYGDVFLVHSDGSYIQKAKPLHLLNKYMPFCHQSCFVRSGLLKEKKFDITYKCCGDHHFFYHCYKADRRFKYIPCIISAYDINNGVSADYTLRIYENARVLKREKKVIWKIQYIVGYVIYRFRQYLKKILPQNFVKYIKRKKINYLQKIDSVDNSNKYK